MGRASPLRPSCVSELRRIVTMPKHINKAIEYEESVLQYGPRHTEVDFTPEESSASICSDSETEPHSSSSRKVGFGAVEIRQYKQTLGDHPCCTLGCPLQLDWEYIDSQTLSLDTYEAQRSPRKSRQDMRTTWEDRRTMLDEVSDQEIRRNQRMLYRAKSCSRLCDRASDSFFHSSADAGSL
jgi:hypothetical protein